MDSQMAGPMCVKLSGVVRGCAGSDLGQKKIPIFKLKFFLEFFFASYLTLYDLCTRDDSLGFEDCRLATHLLNLLSNKCWKLRQLG